MTSNESHNRETADKLHKNAIFFGNTRSVSFPLAVYTRFNVVRSGRGQVERRAAVARDSRGYRDDDVPRGSSVCEIAGVPPRTSPYPPWEK